MNFRIYVSAMWLILGVFTQAWADGILKKVPMKNVAFVLTIHGERMNSKMQQEELSKLPFVQEMLKDILKPDEKDSSMKSLDMLGINLKATSVFFVEFGDSAVFFNYIFPIQDAEKFKAIQAKTDSVKTDEYGNYYVEQYSSVLIWNKTTAVFVSAEVESEYRYSYEDAVTVDTAYADPYDYEPEEGYIPDSSYTSPDGPSFNQVDTIAIVEGYIESDEDAYYEEIRIFPADTAKMAEYTRPYEEEPSISAVMALHQAWKLIAGEPARSILENPRFMKSQRFLSDMTFWAGMEKDYVLNSMKKNLGAYYYYFTMPVSSPLFSEDNYVYGHLSFEGKSIRAEVITHLNKKLAKSYKRMYSSKISNKMIRQVKSDNLFGFISSASDMKAVLEETPALWKNYLQAMPYTYDISDEIVDLIFLFIDTKSISKLYQGDMLMAFTGLVSKEVPYTSYEYDSSFTMVPVEKMRTQSYPEFVFMYNTRDPESTRKFFSILYKKGMLKMDEKKRYYYTMPFGDQMPFQLYFVVKRNGVYVCNSESQLEVLLSGRNKNKLSATHKKLIRSNSFSMYADINNMIQVIQSGGEKISDPQMYVVKKYGGTVVMKGKGVAGAEMLTSCEISSPKEFSNSFEAVNMLINDIYLNDQDEERAEPTFKLVQVDGTLALESLTSLLNNNYSEENPEWYCIHSSSGTGNAFSDFSQGHIDLVKSVRPISASEDSTCKANKVEYIEIPIGYDAVAFIVNAENTWMKDISLAELKLLWAPEAKGKITHWNQIRKEWPNERIMLYGHGNYSAYYNFLATTVGADLKIRSDYTLENDNELLMNWVGKNKYAFGFVRYSDYMKLKTKIKMVPVDDKMTANGKGGYSITPETVQNAEYAPFSRALYIYVNAKTLEENASFKKFFQYYMDNMEEQLSKADCIPLEADVYTQARKRVDERILGSEWRSPENSKKTRLKEVYRK